MIVVTGANGRIGSRVARSLLDAGENVRVFVRDEHSARARFADAATQPEICVGDLGDVSAVGRTMEGADAVFLASPVHPDQVRDHGFVVQAAARSQARVVKLSGLATFPGSFVDSGRWHAETETQVQELGLDFTFLHPYFFMQNLSFQLPAVAKSGAFRSAVSDPMSMVDADDIAAAGVAVLRDPELAPNQTLPLTERVALTGDEVAAVFAAVLEREVRFEQLSLEAVEANLRSSGQPDWHVQILMQFNRAFAQGLAATPDGSLARVLGRPPRTLAEALEEMLASSAEGSNPFPS